MSQSLIRASIVSSFFPRSPPHVDANRVTAAVKRTTSRSPAASRWNLCDGPWSSQTRSTPPRPADRGGAGGVNFCVDAPCRMPEGVHCIACTPSDGVSDARHDRGCAGATSGPRPHDSSGERRALVAGLLETPSHRRDCSHPSCGTDALMSPPRCRVLPCTPRVHEGPASTDDAGRRKLLSIPLYKSGNISSLP